METTTFTTISNTTQNPSYWTLYTNLGNDEPNKVQIHNAEVKASNGTTYHILLETDAANAGLDGSTIKTLTMYDRTTFKLVCLYGKSEWCKLPNNDTIREFVQTVIRIFH